MVASRQQGAGSRRYYCDTPTRERYTSRVLLVDDVQMHQTVQFIPVHTKAMLFSSCPHESVVYHIYDMPARKISNLRS